MMRVITRVEQPYLRDLLHGAFRLSQRYGLEDDKLFNNTLGRNLRRIFDIAQRLHLNFFKQAMAETVFWLTLCQYGRHRLALTLKGKLKVEPPPSPPRAENKPLR